MPILLDRYLQEQIPQDPGALPVAFYRDELAALPGRAGPVHWHPFLELATARQGVLDCQVGQTHITLAPGDSILINQNRLHSFRQLSGGEPDPLPILVFSGTVIAPRGQRRLPEIRPAGAGVQRPALCGVPRRRCPVGGSGPAAARRLPRYGRTAPVL